MCVFEDGCIVIVRAWQPGIYGLKPSESKPKDREWFKTINPWLPVSYYYISHLIGHCGMHGLSLMVCT